MFSLWRSIKTKQLKIYQRNPSPRHMKKYSFLKKFSVKRISLPASQGSWQEASMTVEAAIVLPLFLFFFLNLGSAVEMMRLHGRLQFALWDVGSRLSAYGAVMEREDKNTLGNLLAGAAFSHSYLRGEITEYAGEEYLNTSPLTNGAEGLLLLESNLFGKGDVFDILLTYEVSTPFSLAGFPSFRMANRYYGRVWNGYEVAGGGNEGSREYDTVYLTEKGKVYHEERDCRHLNVSIKEIEKRETELYRNEQGEKYTLCERCAEKKHRGRVYITEDGNRFHHDRDCSALKRTVYSVLRKEVQGLPACKTCSAG